jgi:predicted metal-dependent HD superfamily phosphohydrolase
MERPPVVSLDAWTRDWRALGVEADKALWEQILARYGERHRNYHTVQHLGECLELCEETHTQACRPGEVAVALWFHDAIYEPRRHDNEAQSAAWARRVVSESAAADAAVRVYDMIMATRHDATPLDPDAQLLVDIDLAILGSAPDRFDEYEGQVREEYGWVPGFLFRSTRRRILEGFLNRPRIYATDYFHDRREATARANLRRSIERLAG